MSFDNSYLCDFSVPGLTSLALRENVRLGNVAAEALLSQMRGQETDALSLPYTLVERGSCCSLA